MQATVEQNGVTLRRWFAYCAGGRYVKWAETAQQAREKCERLGYTVERVEPAPPMGT